MSGRSSSPERTRGLPAAEMSIGVPPFSKVFRRFGDCSFAPLCGESCPVGPHQNKPALRPRYDRAGPCADTRARRYESVCVSYHRRLPLLVARRHPRARLCNTTPERQRDSVSALVARLVGLLFGTFRRATPVINSDVLNDRVGLIEQHAFHLFEFFGIRVEFLTTFDIGFRFFEALQL